VKIVLRCFPDIAVKNILKSQTNDGIVSSNNNAAPKIIVCLWWLVSRIGAKGILNLLI
jgi:hypothetical protein